MRVPGQTGRFDRNLPARRPAAAPDRRARIATSTQRLRPSPTLSVLETHATPPPVPPDARADLVRLRTPAPAPAAGEGAWTSGTQWARYVIESRLAVGGMAEAWRAKLRGAEGFEKQIVIKTMLVNLQHRPELVRMFIAEAALAAQLSHPNIVQVFDFGELEGRYFIAMEYVPGLTLRQCCKRLAARGRRLSVAAALYLMVDVCEALHHLHDLADGEGPMGLVHRDVSPDNVIIGGSGTAKLLDFGAARATARTAPSASFVGKYRYAAPERIRHLREDRRSDVFSAGAVLYECLTGARPFEGSDADVIAAIVSGPAPDPRVRMPDLPEVVARIVGQAMSIDAEARHATARDLAIDLLQALSELGAASKEREVAACLSELLHEADSAAAAATASAAAAVASGEAAPQEEPSDVYEIELLEPSGPVPAPRADVPLQVVDQPTSQTSVERHRDSTADVARVMRVARPLLGDSAGVALYRLLRLGAFDEAAGAGMPERAHAAGKRVGQGLGLCTVDELVALCATLKLGLIDVSLFEPSQGRARVELRECAACAGLDPSGHTLCHFEAGLLAGAFETITRRTARARETTCAGGHGHARCGFDIDLSTG